MDKDIHMAGPWVTTLEEEFVLDALRNGWYGKDAYTYCHKFEDSFAKYHDRNYALMTPNCTSAIHLLLAGLGIQDDDEVIVPDCTWIASVAGIHYLRAKPIFTDIESSSWCLCPKAVAANITEKTKAILAVNLYGNMANMPVLQQLADKHNLYLIEDAAESLGSKLNGIRSGKFGIGSVFSFHRTKTITTGEGGILLLDDEQLFNRCKFLRDHGRQPGSYFNTEVTFKYMPFNLQAALAYGQFLRIDELVNKKRWIWQRYRQQLQKIPDIELNPEPENQYNGVWCTALVAGKSHNKNKEEIMDALTKKDLPVRPFFYPLTSLPAFGSMQEKYKEINPNAYDISGRSINLPSALNITEKQIDSVCQSLVEIFSN